MTDIKTRLLAVDHMNIEDCFLQSPLFAQAAATISSPEARIEELEGFEVIGVQHRIRIKGPTASWSEWREGSLNLTEKALEYLDAEERQVYARRTLSKGTGQ